MPTFFRRNRSVEENRSQAPEKAGFEQPRNVCRGVFFTVLLLLFCSAFPPAVPLFAETDVSAADRVVDSLEDLLAT